MPAFRARDSVSHHRHNEAATTPGAVERAKAGASVAIVTDAGTPLVSDPGARLVRAALAEGIPVETVPGPSAALAALVISGLSTDRFCFEGFVPRSGRQRGERLAAIAGETDRAVVIFESPHRLQRALDDLLSVCGPDRPIAVCRELTKIHEEVWRTTTGEAAERSRSVKPRGEYVLVVGPPPAPPRRATDGGGPASPAFFGLMQRRLPKSARYPGPVGRFYVTTPIYYVNDAPHIGHAYTTLTADALARWHRLLGDDVFFLTGTDEHGLKVKRSAEANGLDPQEQADVYSARFRDAWELLDISNDDFIRTTEPRHHRAVSALMQAVYDNGWITLGTYEGLYCVACEAYYTEADLVNGLCPVHHRPVELLKEKNYFFRLSAFSDRLLEWYADNPGAVTPEARRNEALGLIRGGLQDISVTRTSLDWGVRVPWDSDHVFYVWYDALINYATAVGYGSDIARFEQWWPAVHHLIGKDILRFHCVYWPALCMAAGIEPPPRIAVHGFLLVGGEKMSKTAFNQISPAGLVPEFGVDGFRYHFLRDQQFGPDGDFSYEAMVARYNADLANNLGNLLARVSAVVEQKCGGIGPAPRLDSPLAALATEVYEAAAVAWADIAPSEALEATWRLVRAANAALEAAEPWRAEPGPAVDAVLGDALEVLRIVAVLASPAMTRAHRQRSGGA